MSSLFSYVAKLALCTSLLLSSTFASPPKGLNPRLKWTLRSTCLGMMEDGYILVENVPYSFEHFGEGTYTGCIKDGQPDGPGVAEFTNGQKFIGNFLNGEVHEGFTKESSTKEVESKDDWLHPDIDWLAEYNDDWLDPSERRQRRHHWYKY